MSNGLFMIVLGKIVFLLMYYVFYKYILYKYDYDLIWGFYYFDDFRGWEVEFIKGMN